VSGRGRDRRNRIFLKFLLSERDRDRQTEMSGREEETGEGEGSRETDRPLFFQSELCQQIKVGRSGIHRHRVIVLVSPRLLALLTPAPAPSSSPRGRAVGSLGFGTTLSLSLSLSFRILFLCIRRKGNVISRDDRDTCQTPFLLFLLTATMSMTATVHSIILLFSFSGLCLCVMSSSRSNWSRSRGRSLRGESHLCSVAGCGCGCGSCCLCGRGRGRGRGGRRVRWRRGDLIEVDSPVVVRRSLMLRQRSQHPNTQSWQPFWPNFAAIHTTLTPEKLFGCTRDDSSSSSGLSFA
jgi:hypothetical protein